MHLDKNREKKNGSRCVCLFVCFSKRMWRDGTMTFLPSLKATYKSVVNFKKKDSTSKRDCFSRFRGLKRNTFQGDGWSFQRTRWGSSREVVWGILVCKGNLHSQKFQLHPLWLEADTQRGGGTASLQLKHRGSPRSWLKQPKVKSTLWKELSLLIIWERKFRDARIPEWMP